MSIDTTDKIYFAYTPYIQPAEAWDFWVDAKGMPHVVWYSRARGTIALQKIGGEIHYGVSVCSEEDNFSKKEGRAMAEARLKGGYGKYMLDPELAAGYHDDHELCLYLLRNMANSVAKDIRKTQQKIGKKKLPKEIRLLTASKENLHKV